jgi:DNA primase small subunit
MSDQDIQNTIKYLKKKFAGYYERADLTYPTRFTRREWGFMFLGENYMQRHIKFKTHDHIRAFLTGGIADGNKRPDARFRVPAHVYYSSAYYSDPGLQPMPKKVEGWLGADLIFDVDDEHIRGIEGLTYAQRLEKVKNIISSKLLNDFLLDDFGFNEEFIDVAFSGSRGYHIHIKDPKVLELGSTERREIVDYIIGLGLDYTTIFASQIFDLKEFGGRRVATKTRVNMPEENAKAWKNRMRTGVLNLLSELESLDKSQAIILLLDISHNITFRSEGGKKTKRLGRKGATDIYNDIFSGKPGVRGIDRIRNDNILEIFTKDSYRNMFIELVKAHAAVEMAGETDEPVTTDVKRLIRMPSSLHGKTGFMVKPLTIEQLDEFDPLIDAIVFSDEPVNIKLAENTEFDIKGKHFSLEPGVTEIPEHAAIFLMCQRKAFFNNFC